MIKAAQLIKEGLIGEVKTVVGYCRGWLLSMNSHQTDMICQFAGYDPIAVTAKGSIKNIPDMSWHSIDNVPLGYEPEPDLDSMIIEYKSGVVGIQIGEHNDFWGLYCDVFGTLGRIRIQSDLLHISGYMGHDKKINVEELDLPENDGVFKVAYNQFSEHLNNGTPIDCCDDDMVAVQENGLAAVESIKTKERISLPCKNRYSLVHIL